MKTLVKIFLVWAFVIAQFHSMAQVSLSEILKLNSPQVNWLDANNDSLLDISAGGKAGSFKKQFIIQGTGTDSLSNYYKIDSIYKSSCVAYTDFNHDNKIDVIISGILLTGKSSTQVFINKGNFEYEKMRDSISDKAFQIFLFADLNSDGANELIGADAEKLYILANDSGKFIPKKDTALNIISIQSFDFDGNGFKDVAFSGFNSNKQPITMIWFMQDKFLILKRIIVTTMAGTLEAGDLNHDGYFDLVVAGRDANGKLTTEVFNNNVSAFTQAFSLVGLDSAFIRIADFTSDGLADIALRGKDSSGNYLNWIKTASGDSIPLLSNHLKSQDFGDYDGDSDLDWVQLTGDSLKIYNNNLGPENKGPGQPTHPIGLQIYDRTFFYWNKPADDHTDANSITYDLRVFNADTTIVASEFDSNLHTRLLVSHGNMGTSNFSLQKIQGNYNFDVQSIDNAFVPSVICHGVCTTCATIDHQDITACGQSPAVLTPPAPQAMWFSLKKGFVGIADTYAFDDVESDTIFSFNPMAGATCANLRLFNITAAPSDTIRLIHTLYNCQGQNVTMNVDPEWKNVAWKNNLNNATASGESLVHKLIKEITFAARASNDSGCALKEEFILKISKPNLQLNGNQFQIMNGSSVQLSASGAEQYDWKPAATLNDNQIANPVASPEETTEYTITAYDSLGCTSEGKVLVEVFEEAFIPTLFTPNDDGKNDNLRIYGLTHASGFRFAIYNREGSKLFETTSIDEATHSGWAGVVNGTRQPPGTYYWKVEGRMPKGDLLLNGKKSGVVLLVR